MSMKHLRRLQRMLAYCCGFSVLPVFLSCSLLIEKERQQCVTDKDCEAYGPEFAGGICLDTVCSPDPKWACAENPEIPEPQGAIDSTLTIMNVVDFQLVPDIHVRLCGTLDLSCRNPLGEGISGPSGQVLFRVPEGFGGYLVLEGDAIEPVLYFPSLPIKEGEALGYAYVNPAGALEDLATQLGDVVQPGRGLAVVQIFDCQQAPAVGVTVEFDGDLTGALPYYALQGIPSPNATFVDDTGVAGLLNAPTGALGVNVKLGTRTIGSFSMLIRDGYVSFAVLQLGKV